MINKIMSLWPVLCFCTLLPAADYGQEHAPVFRIGTDPFKYSGYYADTESGLCYCKARYYSPGLGRFTSRDRYDIENRYAYCGGEPISRTDPEGHFFNELKDILTSNLQNLISSNLQNMINDDFSITNIGVGLSFFFLMKGGHEEISPLIGKHGFTRKKNQARLLCMSGLACGLAGSATQLLSGPDNNLIWWSTGLAAWGKLSCTLSIWRYRGYLLEMKRDTEGAVARLDSTWTRLYDLSAQVHDLPESYWEALEKEYAGRKRNRPQGFVTSRTTVAEYHSDRTREIYNFIQSFDSEGFLTEEQRKRFIEAKKMFESKEKKFNEIFNAMYATPVVPPL